jgi:hypothetical protein
MCKSAQLAHHEGHELAICLRRGKKLMGYAVQLFLASATVVDVLIVID